jgi:hypothetical protein
MMMPSVREAEEMMPEEQMMPPEQQMGMPQ